MAARANLSVAEAAQIVRGGGVVAFPTETVYGLGADATQDRGVAKIYELKARPRHHPLIAHLADADWLSDWTIDAPDLALRLAETFWPGPLTLVLRPAPELSKLVSAGQGSVAVRVPEHAMARELIAQVGRPVAAPSANRFGRLSPTSASHVYAEFGDEVAVLDGGLCGVGVESTIVDLTGATPAILRPGGITRESLQAAAGIEFTQTEATSPRVPGSLPSHYAPDAIVEICDASQLLQRAQALAQTKRHIGVVLFGGTALELAGVECIVLPADLSAAAQGLYAALRELDTRGCATILCSLPAETGIGHAIADRLRRAAGPRD